MFRSRVTQVCTTARGFAGTASPQIASISSSNLTNRLGRSRSIASKVRCLPETWTG